MEESKTPTMLEEEQIKLPNSILNKIRVINDTPEIPLETEDKEVGVSAVISDTPKVKETKKDASASHSEDVTSEKQTSNQKISVDPEKTTSLKAQKQTKPKAPVVPRGEIAKTRKELKCARKVILQMQTANTCKEAIKKEADYIQETELGKILNRMPIEQLNSGRLGIRVSAMRNAGYTTVGSIRYMSSANLESIYGVGEKSAYLARNMVLEICNRERAGIDMRPIALKKYRAETLVQKTYIYIHLEKWKQDMHKKYDDQYKAIQTYLNFTKMAGNPLFWLFVSQAKKQQMLEPTEYYQGLLHSNFLEELQSNMNQIQTIKNVSENDAWNDYLKNKQEYEHLIC